MTPLVVALIAVLVGALLSLWLLRGRANPSLPTADATKAATSKLDEGKKAPALAAPARPQPDVTAAKAASRPPGAPSSDKQKPEAKVEAVEEELGRGATYDPIVVQRGLARTRGGLMAKLAQLVRGHREMDPAVLQQIEEILLTNDVGVATTQKLIERLHARLKNNELGDGDKVWAALKTEALEILGAGGRIKLRGKPTVLMLVGVNGAGKTTTIGKLASKLKAQGKQVVLGAGDTFRAAAVQQLEVWGQREGATVIKGKEQADPASVLFEAVNHAKTVGADVVLCDTAGRLHTKANLMDELAKVYRSIGKAIDGAPHETLLVLDATNGQNALQQARQFREAIAVTGVVLTKLDGTAKGGVVLAIADELGLPVRYIGIGERPADLREFDPKEFVEALFSARESLPNEAA